MTRRLYRSRSNAMVGGVAAGIAEYFDLDPTLIRLVWVLLLFTGTGLLLYLIAWIVIPPHPKENRHGRSSAPKRFASR